MHRRTITISLFTVAGLLLSTLQAAVEVTLLGPDQYTRSRGAPTLFLTGFPGAPGTATLHVTNGDADGRHRVSSAVIRVNGHEVLGPSDFNQQVATLERTIAVGRGNSLRVELRSKPGSFLTIQVTQVVEAETAEVVGPQGGVVAITDPSSNLFGTFVAIPPNALSRSEVITIAEVIIDDAGPNPVLELGPSGLLFSTPVEVRMPYEEESPDQILGESTSAIFRFDEFDEAWEALPTVNLDSDNNRVTGRTEQFSRFTVSRDGVRHETPTQLATGHPVVLVHGVTLFDEQPRGDATNTFGDLHIFLSDLGYDVWSFNYNTGQFIELSAGSLGRATTGILTEKIAAGFPESCGLTIIAHSMGGLVTRGYIQGKGVTGLFNPVPYNGEVSTIIMTGVPNHGSVFGSINYLLAGISDLAFPLYSQLRLASVELVPGSSFLEMLNDTTASMHRLPPEISYHVIHGEFDKFILTLAPSDGIVLRSSSELFEWETIPGYTIMNYTVEAAHVKVAGIGWEPGIAKIESDDHPTLAVIRTILPDGICTAPVTLFDDFNDGDFTQNPPWTEVNNDDFERTVDVVGGALRFLTSGSFGNGGLVGVQMDVDIPVDDSTAVIFDGKVVSRNVRNGCGNSCGEFPVNMQLELETSSGDQVFLRYALNFGDAIEDKDLANFKQRALSVPRNQWVRDITNRIRGAWPTAVRITNVFLFGAGWSFEGLIDNVELTEQL